MKLFLEEPNAAIRRDCAERIGTDDVALGPPTVTFAWMASHSHVLPSRCREIENLGEGALGDAIADETGTDDPQQRIAATQLASVHRVLFAEGARRILTGQSRDEIRQFLELAARRAFDLLKPSVGDCCIRD